MNRHPGEGRDLVEKDRVLDMEGHGVARRGPGFRRDDAVHDADLAAGSENGFTLVELLVSLLIFSLLSAAGVALLSFSVRAQESAGARLDDLAALRRAGALIAGDLAQAAPRLQRDQAGRSHPAFFGGTGETGLALAFVRRGWENGDEAPRPSLQKVEYGLVDGRLLRRAYPMVDGAAPFASVPLLERVDSLRFRYRDQKGEWRDRWDPTDPSRLPRAVEMVVAVAGRGTTRQLFLAGAEL
jgi:general secretion pathway protein J